MTKEIKVTITAVTTDDGNDCDESCPSFEFTDHGPHWCRYWDDSLLYGRLRKCREAALSVQEES